MKHRLLKMALAILGIVIFVGMILFIIIAVVSILEISVMIGIFIIALMIFLWFGWAVNYIVDRWIDIEIKKRREKIDKEI